MENFDLKAKDFDTDKRIERAKIIANEIRLHIKDGNTKSAIDYGCGTGLVGLQLSDKFTSLTLVDSSSEMIAQVEHKLKKMGNPSILTQCADFTATEALNLKTDYIFSSLVLHHIKDTDSIFRCFYNILNDNGHLIIVDIVTDDGSFHAKYPDFDGHNGFDPSYLIALATKIGFTKAEAKTFYNGKKSFNGKDSLYSLFILDAAK